MPIKVILDTDIGSDIDDAVCLAYLLSQPDCELMGITTVSGKPVERAKMASAQCRVAGKDVPIYPGSEYPLINPIMQPEVPQAVALEKWPHQTQFPKGQAVEFMRRTIRENPGEIVLLPIGPLTNIAALFAADEEIPSLLKGLVLMGGDFYRRTAEGLPHSEWNIRNDPHAAAVVYRAAAPLHRSIGLDVTTKVVLQPDEVRRRFESKVLKPVRDFAEVWFSKGWPLTFHDPLAGATIFQPDLCTYERGQVKVDLSDGKTKGATLFTADANGPHEVAKEVNAERFLEHFFQVTGDR
jgi:purine nucleosidase